MSDAESGPEDATEFWETRYRERDGIWSGRPNDALVSIATSLQPGRALDLGCGEGGDTLWLAAHGWRVTAVDISETAVSRARLAGIGRGVPERQITWVVADLRDWRPNEEVDLVSACFLHSPVDFPRGDVLRRAAQAVAVGGHLLIVGHAEPPPWSQHHDHDHGRLLDPGDEFAELGLDESGWEVEVKEVRSREATGPDGEHAVLDDNVLLIRRR